MIDPQPYCTSMPYSCIHILGISYINVQGKELPHTLKVHVEGIASLHRYKVNVDNMVCNIHMEGMAYMHRCNVRVEPQPGDVHGSYLILVWYVVCVGMYIQLDM